VGGAIRDTLLGEDNTDYDIATSAPPDEVQRLFRHTVPVGARFGTVAVRVHRRHHEVTTFRRDVSTDGRHAVVEYGVSLDEDLARRDFSINAIAYHPLRHEWRDPWNGAADLDARLIRAVGVPAERFREDYLRILRGSASPRGSVSISARTGAPCRRPPTACRGSPPSGSATSGSRGCAGRSPSAVSLILAAPAARRRSGSPSWRRRTADGSVGEHGESPGPRVGALASRRGVLPTLGGGSRRQRPARPGVAHVVLCIDPVSVLMRLKASNAEIARATGMVTGPEEPASAALLDVRRWMAAVGEAADDLARLWHLRHGAPPAWAAAVRGIRERGDPLTRKQLAVTGEDLRGRAWLPARPWDSSSTVCSPWW
jgi:hypothetical protein